MGRSHSVNRPVGASPGLFRRWQLPALCRVAVRRALVLAVLVVVAPGCFGPAVGGSTLGMRSQSGLVRLTETSFGLLIYPCVERFVVSEVVLSAVDLGETHVILREQYPTPARPRDLIVSTDAAAQPAVAGGIREIVNAELLDRFNNDDTYLTSIDFDHFLDLEAFAPDGTDVSGGSTLGGRFRVDVGRVTGMDLDPVRLDEVRCPDEDGPAWDVAAP